MAIIIDNKYYDFGKIIDVLDYLLIEQEYDLCIGDEDSLKEQLVLIREIVENHYKDVLKDSIIETEIEDVENLTDYDILAIINENIDDFNEESYLFNLYSKEEIVKIWKDNNKN